VDSGEILVSEPLANRLNLPKQGGELQMFTSSGLHTFKIAGIYYDYASSQGSVLMSLRTYRSWWQDPEVTAMALRLKPGVNPDQMADRLRSMISSLQHLLVRPNQALRQEVLVVFDRTFAITGALQVLATVVAFIGVLSALLSLQLERQRELGILRAIGLTTRQLWFLILGETSLIGLVAGLMALPTGYVLSLILIYIINLRSFGWTLQMQVLPQPFLQALAVSIIAALLAGIYPAYHTSHTITAEAMRFE
jgi:putative ABC transport system permease protein